MRYSCLFLLDEDKYRQRYRDNLDEMNPRFCPFSSQAINQGVLLVIEYPESFSNQIFRKFPSTHRIRREKLLLDERFLRSFSVSEDCSAQFKA